MKLLVWGLAHIAPNGGRWGMLLKQKRNGSVLGVVKNILYTTFETKKPYFAYNNSKSHLCLILILYEEKRQSRQ
jgi:hypothetical protein